MNQLEAISIIFHFYSLKIIIRQKQTFNLNKIIASAPPASLAVVAVAGFVAFVGAVVD
jgi:hypothetical protein